MKGTHHGHKQIHHREETSRHQTGNKTRSQENDCSNHGKSSSKKSGRQDRNN